MGAWIDVGPAEAITETSPLTTEVDGYPIVIVPCGKDFFAVEVEACEIICPRHGARFSLRTGDALTPPAYEPIRTFNVRVENGRVLVEQP